VDSTTTIVTGRKEIADAIRACVPNKVLEVDSLFIDLAEPGFNEKFEPQFRIMNPKMEKAVRGLRGEVICAIPPGLSCGNLLLHLAHTLKDSPAALLCAPLHDLSPDGIIRALKDSDAIAPWFLTSVAARRMTERLLGMHLIPVLREAGLAYTGWQSLFYLHLISAISRPSWKRHLRFGTCVAVEIDSFGGNVYHRRYPRHVKGDFEVIHKETKARWPDPRFPANQMLRNTAEELRKYREELEQAYFSGACSWPFSYGGVAYGERPVQILSQPTGLLQRLATSKSSRKAIRIYRQDHLLFRSQSYYPEGQASINPLPARAQIKATIDPQLPRSTLEAFLDRLDGCQLNLDFPSILKLIYSDYAQQEGGEITVTPKGEAVLQRTEKTGVSGWRLYVILRLLENIQTDEAAYEAVLRQIQETVQNEPEPCQMEMTPEGKTPQN
jgi:hypothetical protein